MKKAQDIIGLPIISIDKAVVLGEVKGFLIEPNEGKIKYLLIMDDKWYLGGKLIAFDSILSIGRDAITIHKEEDLQQFSEVQDAIELAEKSITIVGAKVFTEKGQYMGTVTEYFINGRDGKISRYQLDDGRGSILIEHPKIISFGSKALVVEEELVEEKLIEEDQIIKKTEPTIPSSTQLFEEKQRQFLLGRKAKKRVLDQSGNILLEEGQVISKEILDRIKDKNKIIELTINTM
ncbi:MAG: hypothetical protein GX375_06215 [Clostridiales bacterium]|nr:hypothetical protein [Clostridiales bacterium]